MAGALYLVGNYLLGDQPHLLGSQVWGKRNVERRKFTATEHGVAVDGPRNWRHSPTCDDARRAVRSRGGSAV